MEMGSYKTQVVTTTKDRIFKAAKKLFANKGFLETTISDIASEAQVSRGLIHWYYKNKEELIKEVALTSFPHNVIRRVLKQEYSSPKELLEELCRAYINFYSDVQNRKLFLHVLSIKDRITELEKVHQVLSEAVMEEGAEKLISLGCDISKDTAEVIFRTLYSSLFFYIQSEKYIKIEISDFFKTLIKILLKGVSCW